MAGVTPSQTVGPFFHLMLSSAAPTEHEIEARDRANRIRIDGRLIDGAGDGVSDGLLETWQADAQGRYAHPEDPQGGGNVGHPGFARIATDATGAFSLETLKPGRAAAPDGGWQAPHILVGVFARGLLSRLVTRIYFEDEPGNATDPILQLVPDARRSTLIARMVSDQRYRFDIVLQGAGETVFFDV